MNKILGIILVLSLVSEIAACEPLTGLVGNTTNIVIEKARRKIKKKKRIVPVVLLPISESDIQFLNELDEEYKKLVYEHEMLAHENTKLTRALRIMSVLKSGIIASDMSEEDKHIVRSAWKKKQKIRASIPFWACSKDIKVQEKLQNYILDELGSK